MQCPQVSHTHVIRFLVVLEICVQVTTEITNELTSNANTTVNDTSCNNCSMLQNGYQKSGIWEPTKPSETNSCSNSHGWDLRGSEWGCCGNYPGCCTYASFVCYIHDALCKCCDIGGNFCGPSCKPEPGCRTTTSLLLQKEQVKQINTHSTDATVKEVLNVEKFEVYDNGTQSENVASRNKFMLGKELSSNDGPLFQDGEDGSGDTE